jgi:hypothetical protein
MCLDIHVESASSNVVGIIFRLNSVCHRMYDEKKLISLIE